MKFFAFLAIAIGLLVVVSCLPAQSSRTYFVSTSRLPVTTSIATDWKDFSSYSKEVPRGELQLTIQQADRANKPISLAGDSFDVIIRTYHVRSAMQSWVDTLTLLIEPNSEPIILVREDSPHFGPEVRDSVDRETWVLGRIYIPSAVDSIRAEFTVRSSFIRDLSVATQTTWLHRESCTR